MSIFKVSDLKHVLEVDEYAGLEFVACSMSSGELRVLLGPGWLDVRIEVACSGDIGSLK